MMLYRFVDAQKAEGFPVRMVCSVVGVSPSAYYAHKQQPAMGPAQLAEAALVDEIGAIWADSDGTYGSPRVGARCGPDERPPYGVPRKRLSPPQRTPLIGTLTCWRLRRTPGLMKPGLAT